MLKWLWESLFFIKIILIFDFFLFHKDKKFGQNYIPQIFFCNKRFLLSSRTSCKASRIEETTQNMYIEQEKTLSVPKAVKCLDNLL